MNSKNKVFLISLGCAKNTVDSETMSTVLMKSNFSFVDNPLKADTIIVNTCGFIRAARDESVNMLQELAQQKTDNQLLIASGCLPDRIRSDILNEVPEIDGMLSTSRWMDIVALITKLRKKNSSSSISIFPENAVHNTSYESISRVAIQGGSAYLKIADGCRRPCAFCSIPLIKGKLQSRTPEQILKDLKYLEKVNTKEVNIIAQDTTDYGTDLGFSDGLANLIDQAINIHNIHIPWLRILYVYPGSVSPKLISLLNEQNQLLPYLDIPLQHADQNILKAMKRPSNMNWVYDLIHKLRNANPSISLRTTFIVGYPGETDKAFSNLLNFIKEIEFDHLGVFEYSFEKGTPAEPLGDPIPASVKAERVEEIMLLQEKISLKKNQQFIGKTMDVLIEGYNDGISIGRTYRDAPEIDGLVIIEGKAPIGEIIPTTITGAMTHDLVGQLE